MDKASAKSLADEIFSLRADKIILESQLAAQRTLHCGWVEGDGPCKLGRDILCAYCELHITMLQHRDEAATLRAAVVWMAEHSVSSGGTKWFYVTEDECIGVPWDGTAASLVSAVIEASRESKQMGCIHGWTDEDGCQRSCDGPIVMDRYCEIHIGFHEDALQRELVARDSAIAELEALCEWAVVHGAITASQNLWWNAGTGREFIRCDGTRASILAALRRAYEERGRA